VINVLVAIFILVAHTLRCALCSGDLAVVKRADILTSNMMHRM
jgi:hypothetical protein